MAWGVFVAHITQVAKWLQRSQVDHFWSAEQVPTDGASSTSGRLNPMPGFCYPIAETRVTCRCFITAVIPWHQSHASRCFVKCHLRCRPLATEKRLQCSYPVLGSVTNRLMLSDLPCGYAIRLFAIACTGAVQTSHDLRTGSGNEPSQ